MKKINRLTKNKAHSSKESVRSLGDGPPVKMPSGLNVRIEEYDKHISDIHFKDHTTAARESPAHLALPNDSCEGMNTLYAGRTPPIPGYRPYHITRDLALHTGSQAPSAAPSTGPLPVEPPIEKIQDYFGDCSLDLDTASVGLKGDKAHSAAFATGQAAVEPPPEKASDYFGDSSLDSDPALVGPEGLTNDPEKDELFLGGVVAQLRKVANEQDLSA